MAMKPRSSGHTLLEIVIYCVLVVLGGLIVWGLFMVARRTQTSSYSSYLIGGTTETAINMLRRDLTQTALGSLQSYPTPTSSGTAPGISMAGALSTDMQVNPYGVPEWDRWVYYVLVADRPTDRTGRLVRWEQAMPGKNHLPQMSGSVPGQLSEKGRVVLHNVLMPNVEVKGLGNAPGYRADQYGGFRVQFVRRAGGPSGAESVVWQSPVKASDPGDNTRLVEVELKILQKSGSGKPDFYSYKFRVRPAF